jgi:threonine 3-dehydrogenase
VALVSAGELKLEKFITHQLSLDEFALAIELLSRDSCKVVFVPGASR